MQGSFWKDRSNPDIADPGSIDRNVYVSKRSAIDSADCVSVLPDPKCVRKYGVGDADPAGAAIHNLLNFNRTTCRSSTKSNTQPFGYNIPKEIRRVLREHRTRADEEDGACSPPANRFTNLHGAEGKELLRGDRGSQSNEQGGEEDPSAPHS